MLHVVAEGNVNVAAVELAGQAAAVKWRYGVRTARGEKNSQFRYDECTADFCVAAKPLPVQVSPLGVVLCA